MRGDKEAGEGLPQGDFPGGRACLGRSGRYNWRGRLGARLGFELETRSSIGSFRIGKEGGEGGKEKRRKENQLLRQ